MIFYSTPYIYFIFIASILIWFIPRELGRTWFIIIFSSIALYSVQPLFTIFLIFLIISVYLSAQLIQQKKFFSIFIFLILALLTILIGFKYASIIFETIFFDANDFSKSYLIPIGISYLSFKLIAFVFDVYRKEIINPRLDDLLAFILFIPIFPAGPIEKFQIFSSSRMKKFDSEFYMGGLIRIIIGFFKKIVIVNFFLHKIVFEYLAPLASSSNEVSSLIIICFLFGALIYGYLDLSSYADIAIGFSNLFGYQICEDMNFPIFRRNLSEYWNNWHMSLSHWCRNYVYFPVLGISRNNYVALYSSFIVMGLWHLISIKWLLWGLWHATGIIIYSHWSRWKKINTINLLPSKLSYFFGVIITIMYSSMGFAFIVMPNANEALKMLASIFY